MKFNKYDWEDLGAVAQVSCCRNDMQDSCEEYHALLHVEPRGELFAAQYARLCQAERKLLQLSEMQGAQIVFRRYYVSDITNQRPYIKSADHAALAVIQQPPLDGSKVALHLYLVREAGVEVELREVENELRGVEVELKGVEAELRGVEKQAPSVTVMRHNGYEHLYQWELTRTEGDSFDQTKALLESYEDMLFRQGCNLAEHCIRTWFYVRDVDSRYAGLVKARRENFVGQGLTSETHYIASTGIGGLPADPRSIVQLDTYALRGIEPQQQRYLYARTHLNPTYEYGVTFERGTVVEYGDRAEVFISGTASINNKGEIVHDGDIVRQTERMWENVNALLAEADATSEDIAQIIVYLRDLCDYPIVKEMFDRRFPKVPRVITLAPVCRPGWLIEMECIAIPLRQQSQYRAF